MAMKCVVLASVFFNVLQVVYMRVELHDFYPYGFENGDITVPTNDDGSSGLVNIGFPFPFFDVEHKSLFVNTNGVISFILEVSQYTPDSFPLDGNRRLIAPFWADVDTREGGVVYYRETQDLAIRTRVSDEIRKYFVRQRRFSAKWVMVVTWLNVGAYGGNATHHANTFQAILATDGLYSFSIFYYNKIEWTFGTASNGIPAQAGFNAGDGIRYFNTPNSRTPAIINVTSTSNYQDPGFWIFQVDGETVKNRGCKSNRGLVLSPRSGIELGGTQMFIGGPCYNPNNEIVCRFNKTRTTPGVYVGPEIAYCITPPLYVGGLILVELSLDGGKTFTYTGTFRSIPLGRNAPDVKGLEVEHWANSTKTILTWDQDLINATHVDIHISLFDAYEFRVHKASLASFERVLNSGKYHLDFSEQNISPKRRQPKSKTESPIAIVSIKPSVDTVRRNSPQSSINSTLELFSASFIVPWLALKSFLCEQWWHLQNTDQIAKLEIELPPCPTSFQQISADNEFVPDSGVKGLLSQFHNSESTSCFRSRSPSASGAGQQCCYNGDLLIVGPPAGGTLNLISPEESFWGHMGRDVLPWYSCCKLTENCGRYYERRPSDRGTGYVPPQVADTRGDPHFSTFDGTFYTFNGYGEYILLQLNNGVDLEFQGRMIPLFDDHGKRTNATALTALVIRGAESDIVQVEFNSRRKIDVLVNRERVEFDEQTRLDFSGVFVVRQNRSKISIYFTSGVSIEVKVIENFLTYQISIPTKFKGKTAGLLGFWDDNKVQEFLLPNGSFIQTNSSYRTLHHEFGQKWMVDRNKTLFKYKVGKSYDSFRDVDFTPVFLDDTSSLFSNATLEQKARNICEGNAECLFDIAVTGKTSIGEATLELINELEEKTNNSKIVLEPIIFGCDGVQNSLTTTDGCGVCGGDNSTCTDCDGNVRPGFVNNGECSPFYHPWSEWSVCFQAGDGMIKARNRTCSEKSKCEHLGENVQHRKCLCNNCNEDDDGDTKSLKYYSLYIGLPLFAFVSVVVILMWCCRLRSAKREKCHTTTFDNRAYGL